ncbi:alpha/beta fold hydrolase [Nakamurella sp. YIM 132087]|uniref:Alpha/beta fold hydrolase n=1 Tax=Nakamurella alba TaxID=2665158 RepID=A0A7K1FHI1_9ACTN|nr:alpha/beta hydrolase [Nakamurella alba]MTD13558.1 alpha/beta fold hydrolase [Nakamurella alba]
MPTLRAAGVDVHHVVHGDGRPVIVLHGAGVDHRETEACVEPTFAGLQGWRRIYPDLPGMGRTPAPASLSSADDVLAVLLDLARKVSGGQPVLLVGHSAGAYYARALACRQPELVAGAALICPLLPGARDVPAHHAVPGGSEIGDDGFRDYFVVHTPEMLERYREFVEPAADLVDQEVMQRIGGKWEITGDLPPYPGPALLVAGRRDSTVGWAATADLAQQWPGATLAVLDHAGHALPHEQPELLRALIGEWLARVERTVSG